MLRNSLKHDAALRKRRLDALSTMVCDADHRDQLAVENYFSVKEIAGGTHGRASVEATSSKPVIG